LPASAKGVGQSGRIILKLRTHNTHSNTAITPHATDHSIRSFRYFIAALKI